MSVIAIRVDERLIHGQVATLWQGVWNCNRIMVIDSKSANDPVLKSVLRIACPGAVRLSVLEASTATKNLLSGKYGNERIVIVTKTPGNILEMVNNGFMPSCDITVGNMSNGEGKKKVTNSICVTDQDIQDFNILYEKGCHLVKQLVPSESVSDFMPLLEAVK